MTPELSQGWLQPGTCDKGIEFPALRASMGGDLRRLCIHAALAQVFGVNQLFLCYDSGRVGVAVSKSSISEWLKLVIQITYR